MRSHQTAPTQGESSAQRIAIDFPKLKRSSRRWFVTSRVVMPTGILYVAAVVQRNFEILTKVNTKSKSNAACM